MSTLDSSEGGFFSRLVDGLGRALDHTKELVVGVSSLSGGITLFVMYRRSFSRGVRIAKKAVRAGCSWPAGSRFISAHFGLVERPPQPFDPYVTPSSHGRFLMFYGPTGTGKSHYINTKLEEERDGFFIHVPCNDHPVGQEQGLTSVVLGEVLGIHKKQYENSILILDEVVRDLYRSSGRRVLVVLEDTGVKEEAVGIVKNALGWCKVEICDVVVAQSECDDLRQIEEELSGTQGKLRYGEYDPPTEEAVIAVLDESILAGTLPDLSRDDAVSFLEYAGVQFAELSDGWAMLNDGEPLEEVVSRFGAGWEEKILRTVNGVIHDKEKEEPRTTHDVREILIDVLEDDYVLRDDSDGVVLEYLVRSNVLRSLPDGYTWAKRGMRMGAERYLSGRGIHVERKSDVANGVVTEDGEVELLLVEEEEED